MNEIDYNVEYRRLKDSTFEEVFADLIIRLCKRGY